MAAKLGFEAIKYVLKKVLTKKGVRGIATIPGKAYDMRMKQLADEMAFKMKELGYDINKVNEKEVQGLLDSAEALAKQKKPVVKRDRPSIRLIKNFEKDLTDIDLAKEGYNLQEIGILKKARNVMKKEGQNPDDALTWVRSEMADDAGVDIEDFMTDFDWGDFPGKAEGGRIGMGGGGLAKGARWFINSLKKNLTDMEAGHPRFKVVPAKDQEMLKVGYRNFIAELERGGEVPIEALQAISKNPQYYKTKKVVRSQDPDLAEVEELIDAKVFGNVRQELKDLETVGRKPNASGGRASLMYGGDRGFAFEYGGSWADWQDKHRDQMPVEQYIKTKLPKDRLPFREMQSGGLAYMLGEPTYMKMKKGGSPKESWRNKLTRWAGGPSALAGELGLEGIHQIHSLLGMGGLYASGGNVGHAPWLKPTGQRQPQQPRPQPQGGAPGGGRPNPMKAPRGLPSLAPRTMDPAVMQQQAMQKAMMGQGQPRMGMDEGGMTQDDFNRFLKEREEMYREGGKHELQKDWEKYKRFRQYGKTSVQEAAGGGRIGLGLGSMSRRAFMKMMAGLAAVPLIGKGVSKMVPKAIPKVTETIVKSNAPGMPIWFPKLVQRVIKEGDDITKTAGTIERQTVHTIKLPESGTPVQVTRDLVTDDVIVDIGEQTKHGWGAGRHGQPAQLVLKKGEWIEPTKTKKGIKTKDEFYVDEAEFTGGHPENIKFEESAIEKYGEHASNFTEVEKFAVGKNVDKKIIGKKAARDDWAEGRAMEQSEDIDFASGGLAYLLGE